MPALRFASAVALAAGLSLVVWWVVPMRPARAAEPEPAGPQAEASSEEQETVVVAGPPRLHIDVDADEAEQLAADVRALPGVAAAAAVTRATLTVSGANGPEALTVAVVDPGAFRPLTPPATAASAALWERLEDGDAAFTHDVGARLELRLGTSVPAGSRGWVRVGAFAANGVPPVADVIVNHGTAERLDVDGQGSVLVAPAEGVAPGALAEVIAEATGRQPSVRDELAARQAFLTGDATRQAFEPFTYLDNGDGMIEIDPDWVRRNIVTARVPILRGQVQCHRLLIDQLRGALAELEARGLSYLIDPRQYGGCHVARHIDFDPAKPLSMHAWGLAVDLNVSTNGLGQRPQMDARVVDVFERWGFTWGGRWNRPDGMHFELGALLDSPHG